MKNFGTDTRKMNGLLVDGDDSAASAPTGNGLDVQQSEPVTEAKPQEQAPQQNGLVTTAPMDEPGTAVATANQSTAVAAAPASMIGGEDVDASELGYGAFPKLKIENGEFDLDGQAAGRKLWVAVVNRRVQRLVKPAGEENPPKEQMAYYTVMPGVNPDQHSTTKGKLVGDFKQSLREEGLKPEEVEYEMVGVQILKFSKDVGDVVAPGTQVEMQIPQASMQRFRGLMFNFKKQDIPMGQRVLEVSVGAKRQSSNGKSYNPWQIDPISATADAVCEKFGINLGSVAGTSLDDLEDF